MTDVKIKCPSTNELVRIGIDMDQKSFDTTDWTQYPMIECNSCGGFHSTETVFLEKGIF